MGTKYIHKPIDLLTLCTIDMGCRFVLESFSACTNRDIYPYFCNNRKGNYISCTHDRHAKVGHVLSCLMYFLQGTCTNRFSGFFDECTVLLSSSTGSCLYKENSKSSSQVTISLKI